MNPQVLWTNPNEKGVMRYYDNTLTNFLTNNSTFASNLLTTTNSCLTLSAFPLEKYLNIYVVENINGSCGLPQSLNVYNESIFYNSNSFFDGIVIRADVFGDAHQTMPNSPICNNGTYNNGKTLVHGVGHYLGLLHTFDKNIYNQIQFCYGSVNCNSEGDFCCDTDPCYYPNAPYDCTSQILNNPCTNTPIDVYNYMYTSYDGCVNYFSKDQSYLMNEIIQTFRNNLVSTNNLISTGVLGAFGCVAQQPIAEFSINGDANNVDFCANKMLTITPLFVLPNNTATNYTWTVTGGLPSNGNGSTFQVMFPTTGNYILTCSATDGISTNVFTKTIKINNCNVDVNYIKNSQWYWGQYAAWNFNSGTPIVNIGPITHNPTSHVCMGASSSIADANGNTIFYTNGSDIWNANDELINDGIKSNINGPIFANPMISNFSPSYPLGKVTTQNPLAQGILIINYPDHPNQYLIIVNKNNYPSNNTLIIKYRIVDVSNQNHFSFGNEQIVTTNILDPMIIVPHCNGHDFWLISEHNVGNTDFIDARIVNKYGISSIPVSYQVGFDAFTYTNQLKASPDNKIIAIASGNLNTYLAPITLLKFNNSNGTFNTQQTLSANSGFGYYGLSFSSNSQFLYASKNGFIDQYDLSNNNSVASIPNSDDVELTMQLAPDDNIYMLPKNFLSPTYKDVENVSTIYNANNLSFNLANHNKFLPVINNIGNYPNYFQTYSTSFTAAQYSPFPNLMDGIVNAPTTPTFIINKTSCQALKISVDPCWDGYYYIVDFGDGTIINSTILPTNLAHTYATLGNYNITVTLIMYGDATFTQPLSTNIWSTSQMFYGILNSVKIKGSNCLPADFLLADVTGGCAPYTYLWKAPIPNILSSSLSYTNSTFITGLGSNIPPNAGIYTVVVTDALGNTVSSTIVLSSGPKQLYASANPASIVCGGSTVLNATANQIPSPTYYPPITFAWYANNLLISSSNPVTVNPNISTIYNVVATDAYGCSIGSSVYVSTPSYPLTYTLSSQYVNCHLVYTITPTSLPNGTIYTLLNNNTASTTNFTVSPANATTVNYTINGINANGCLYTVTIPLTGVDIPFYFCQSNCIPSIVPGNTIFISPIKNYRSDLLIATINQYNAMLPIGLPTISISGSTIGSNSTGTNKTQIYIYGVFELFLYDIKFENCNITLLKGAGDGEIFCGDRNLSIDNCTLQGCTNMWKGITANSLSHHTISITNSRLRDMYNGVVINNLHELTADNNLFIDNYVGLNFYKLPSNYYGSITNNQFSSSGNPLLAPYNTQSKCEIGIEVVDCNNLSIGNLTNNGGNYFDNLYNGIYIRGAYGGTGATNKIVIYNNEFSSINDDNPSSTSAGISAKIASTFSKSRGAAIYAYQFRPSTPKYETLLDINGTNGNAYFEDCDKQVVANAISVSSQNTFSDGCLMGFMNTVCKWKKYNFSDNQINNTFQGITENGDANSSKIINNYISLKETSWYDATNNLLYPYGIKLNGTIKYNSNTNNIMMNTIDVNTDHAFGISLSNTGIACDVENNTINLNATTLLNPNSWLRGLYVTNSFASTFKGNVYNGNSFIISNIISVGSQFVTSQKNKIECNNANNTTVGMFVTGNCSTPYNYVKGNTFTNHGFGLYFNDLGGKGTIGNIGNATTDNANIWYGSYPSNSYGQPNKIYRNSLSCGILHDYIYTLSNLLTQNQSTAAPTCEYKVQNTLNNLYNCPKHANCPTCRTPNDDIALIDPTYSMDVLNDAVVYASDQEVSDWMDKQRLFTELGQDSISRLNSTDFNSFYTTTYTQNIGRIERLNSIMALMSDSVLNIDSSTLALMQTQYKTLNDSITTTKTYDANEQWVNSLSTTIQANGYDSLSPAQIAQLTELANNCPLIAGTAVYKARTLWSYYNSNTIFIDKNLCNAMGQYKKSNGRNNIDDSLLNSIMKSPISNPIVQVNKVILYPNPTDEDINISYNLAIKADATIQFYDVLGRLQESILLPKGIDRVTIKVNNWTHGVYSYKLKQQELILDNGKLLVK